jgi:carboxyl-terminal processing protease
MTKRNIPSLTVMAYRHLTDVIGDAGAGQSHMAYISVLSVSETTGEDLEHHINRFRADGVTHLILDFRRNSGGYLGIAVDIANLLVPGGEPIFQTETAQGRRRTTYSTNQALPFEEVVVLVDVFTASAAELIAAAMQDAGVATIIGQVTYGKGTIQRVFMLPNGGGLSFTTDEYFRGNGGQINEIGVTPDIFVEMSPLDYETYRDGGILEALRVFNR